MSTIPYVHGRHEPRFSAVYTFNKPSRRRNLADGDVDFKQLKKDIERGISYFWGKRPEVHRSYFDFDFKNPKTIEREAKERATRMGPPINPVLDQAEAEVVAMNGSAPRGFLAQTARKYGLDARQLLQRLYRSRRANGGKAA